MGRGIEKMRQCVTNGVGCPYNRYFEKNDKVVYIILLIKYVVCFFKIISENHNHDTSKEETLFKRGYSEGI